jgi:hypothetical protein
MIERETKRLFLQGRKGSYCRVFAGEGDAKTVLKDLAQFCRATASAFHPDPRVHAVLEGRREVYLRIMQHLDLSEQELWDLYEEGK